MAGYGPRIENAAPLIYGSYPMSNAYDQSGYNRAGGGGGGLGFFGNIKKAATGNPLGAVNLGLSGIGMLVDFFDLTGERAEERKRYEEQKRFSEKQFAEEKRANEQQETFQGYDRLANERANVNKTTYQRAIWRAMR